VYCDLKACRQGELVTVRLVPEYDGHFSLIHSSPGVMFTPLANMDTTWRSHDGKTDRDRWDQVWRWRLRYFLIALVDVGLILLPWGYLMALRIQKKRERPAGAG
jgi:hypothetical protein